MEFFHSSPLFIHNFNVDSIIIDGLELSTNIGVPDVERATPQKVLVTVQLQTSTKEAGVSDDVSKTIDYAHVVESIKELAQTERKTIEKFAEDIAAMILKDFKPNAVTVTIKKFILPETDHVSVTINRP